MFTDGKEFKMLKKLLVALVAAFASIIHFTVGMGDLRVSFGIIVFVLALYFNEDMEPISSAIITGIAVFLMRVIVVAISGDVATNLVVSYLLEVLFYIGYGIIYEFVVRHDNVKESDPLVLLLMICDFGGNALELTARYLFLGDQFQSLTLQNLFLAAFIRSALVWIIIKILKNQKRITES